MQYRNGFVSNSSTSSYICSVCGDSEVVDDWEFSVGNSGSFQCENGHYICNVNCALALDDDDIDDIKKIIPFDEMVSLLKKKCEGEVDPYNLSKAIQKARLFEHIPAQYCPICRMEKVDKKEALKYLMLKHTYTHYDDLEKAIIHEFGKDYVKFRKYLQSMRGKRW